jgi:hypothetical protein
MHIQAQKAALYIIETIMEGFLKKHWLVQLVDNGTLSESGSEQESGYYYYQV